jgi:hypothetical protein
VKRIYSISTNSWSGALQKSPIQHLFLDSIIAPIILLHEYRCEGPEGRRPFVNVVPLSPQLAIINTTHTIQNVCKAAPLTSAKLVPLRLPSYYIHNQHTHDQSTTRIAGQIQQHKVKFIYGLYWSYNTPSWLSSITHCIFKVMFRQPSLPAIMNMNVVWDNDNDANVAYQIKCL